MDEQQQSLETLRDIKRMMEQSSRFISLSGLSGVAAGICALAGAWFANAKIKSWLAGESGSDGILYGSGVQLIEDLLLIAVLTLVAAVVSAFVFTYLRSRKNNIPIWGKATWRLLWNTLVPLCAGAFVILRMMQFGWYELVAPGCLIFYGLALVNASKYTLGEVRYLGYAQLILGIGNLWFTNHGLGLWAIGFGVLHIIYGAAMWWKYERNT
jgi:hypothetical protein